MSGGSLVSCESREKGKILEISFQYHSDTDKENIDSLGLAFLAELFFCEIDIQSNVNKYY